LLRYFPNNLEKLPTYFDCSCRWVCERHNFGKFFRSATGFEFQRIVSLSLNESTTITTAALFVSSAA
jgi:hypothetical protein